MSASPLLSPMPFSEKKQKRHSRFFSSVDEQYDSLDHIKNSHGEPTFRRMCAYVLGLAMFFLLSISMALNWYEGSTALVVPLGMATIAPVLSFFWLMNENRSVMPPLFLLSGTLAALGGYLLLQQGAPNGGSLLWFAIFPSMVMFSLGLRYGTLMFAGFYLFVLLLFLTPMSGLMPVAVPASNKVRLLLSMFGSFAFSWSAEYIRHKTHLALIYAMTRLEQEALTDALTGLGNRRDFDRYLSWIVAKSERSSQPFSLALIDIDHFKKINDYHGHEIGDQVLKHIAEQISVEMRASDRLFRWGGEEFTLIMPDSTMHEARLVAERIRLHIEDSPFTFDDDKKEIYHTISIGLYSGVGGTGKNKPLVVADECLYKAKTTGRNKVVG